MHPGTRTRRAMALVAVSFLLLDATAGTVTETWPVEPNTAVLAANLPFGEGVALDITLAVAGDGNVFIAWENATRRELRAQKLAPDGTRAWGATGVAVRTAGTDIQPAGDRRVLSNGPLDVVPTPDGGMWIAWSEADGPGRSLRVQHLDADGALRFSPAGREVFANVALGDRYAAVAGDGADGLDIGAVLANGQLRLQHVAGDGTTRGGGGGLVLDDRDVAKRYPTLARLPNGGVAVTWVAEDTLRLQVVRGRRPRIASPGAVLAADVEAGFRSVHVVGSARVPKLLVTYLARGDRRPHVVLARRGGSVVFDEVAAPGDVDPGKRLREAPEITTVGGVRRGAPVGIELHGIADDGTSMRFLRVSRSVGWTAPEAIVPPAEIYSGMTGALAGPLWTWDMGNRSADNERLRLVAYRTSTLDDRRVPRLGPWLALCPGYDDGSRLVRAGPWLYLTWVVPQPSDASIRATRVAVEPVPGESEMFGSRIAELVVGVADQPSGARSLDVTAPSATLAAQDDTALRLLVGDDGGTKATLLPTRFESMPSGAWTADLASEDGEVTATVRVGDGAEGLTIHVDDLPFDAGDRALYLRIETAQDARMVTALLAADAGGATFSGSSE